MGTDSTAVAGPVVRGVRPLAWTAEREPNDECRYNHCIAETPFGRFLLTWKAWKDYPIATADETPWGEWFDAVWADVAKAKVACEHEYGRRVALCLAA